MSLLYPRCRAYMAKLPVEEDNHDDDKHPKTNNPRCTPGDIASHTILCVPIPVSMAKAPVYNLWKAWLGGGTTFTSYGRVGYLWGSRDSEVCPISKELAQCWSLAIVFQWRQYYHTSSFDNVVWRRKLKRGQASDEPARVVVEMASNQEADCNWRLILLTDGDKGCRQGVKVKL